MCVQTWLVLSTWLVSSSGNKYFMVNIENVCQTSLARDLCPFPPLALWFFLIPDSETDMAHPLRQSTPQSCSMFSEEYWKTYILCFPLPLPPKQIRYRADVYLAGFERCFSSGRAEQSSLCPHDEFQPSGSAAHLFFCVSAIKRNNNPGRSNFFVREGKKYSVKYLLRHHRIVVRTESSHFWKKCTF